MVREPLAKDILEVQIKALEAALDASIDLNRSLQEENMKLLQTIANLERDRFVQMGAGNG